MTKTYSAKSSATRAAKAFAEKYSVESGFTVTGDADSGFMVVVTCDNAKLSELARDAGFATEDLYTAPAKKSKSGYIRGVSMVGGPCALVWAIADAMKEENPSATRKEIMQACMNSGVTYGTARTQYEKWRIR